MTSSISASSPASYLGLVEVSRSLLVSLSADTEGSHHQTTLVLISKKIN